MSMNLAPGSTRITSDSAIGRSGKPYRLFSVILKSGGSASTLALKNGTSTSGTEYDSVIGEASAVIRTSYAGGLLFPDGLYADVDANISYAVLIGTNEQ